MNLRYTKIFVGREKEMEILNDLFIGRTVSASNNKDDMSIIAKVFSYLNSPGVGKTTLLREFGEIIERENRGIHIDFSCGKNHKDEISLVNDLYHTIMGQINQKIEFIENYIERYTGLRKKRNLRALMILLEIIDKDIINGNFNFGSLKIIITTLNGIIPVFLSTDEIQKLEMNKLEDGSSMLHPYAEFLAGLLPQKMLLVISGTQYHILSKIGSGIGSPLNGKIKSVVIGPLKSDHITEYIRELKKLYSDRTDMDELEDFMHTYSGGHPRTMEFITEMYLLLDKYDSDILLLNTKNLMKKSILDTDKIQGIRDLQSEEEFEFIKQWIIRGLSDNFKLSKTSMFTDAQENIVYELMTIGIVIENGNSDYYITSYFHLLAFLDTLVGDYEQFLHHVLQNKNFKKLVGGHSGIGYTFETILFYSLLVKGNDFDDGETPFNIDHLNEIKRLDYVKLSDELYPSENNVIYHTPSTEAIDGYFISDGEIVLVQITTSSSPAVSKLTALENAVVEIQKSSKMPVRGWFISLFECGFDNTENVIISDDNDLIAIIGRDILIKMRETKQFKFT